MMEGGQDMGVAIASRRLSQEASFLYILLPILIVLSTLLFVLVSFLIALVIIKRRARVRWVHEVVKRRIRVLLTTFCA